MSRAAARRTWRFGVDRATSVACRVVVGTGFLIFADNRSVVAYHAAVPQTARWDRISDTGPRQLRFLVDQALGMLAEDLLERLGPTLRELGGEDWPRTLAEQVSMPNRRAHELSTQDVTAYSDLLRSQAQGWEPGRTQLRAALTRGRPYRSVDQLIQGVVDVRNSWAHRKAELDVDATRAQIAAVVRCASELNLARLADYRALQAHLLEVAAGRLEAPPTSDQIEAMAVQIEAQGRELHALREGQERRDAEVEALASRAANAEDEARQARQAESEVRKQQAELERTARSADKAAVEEAQQKLDRLATERAALESQRRAAENEAAQIAEERETLEAARAQVALREAELDVKDRDLQVRIVEAQSTVTHDELLERLRGIVARTQDLADRSPLAVDDELPAPGKPWPYQRGAEVWTLSKQRRLFFRVDDDTTLADLVGTKRAEELVTSFLAIRPTGGRAWVDVDGDAATYVDSRLVYLGRLEQAATSDEPGLGDPVDAATGRRYTVRLGSIRDGSGTTLASVRGAQTSKQVLERLLHVRPKGGVYRVNREGRAVTYVEGRWVYAGTVRAAEWFPGHVR
jgi:hypothetical protein